MKRQIIGWFSLFLVVGTFCLALILNRCEGDSVAEEQPENGPPKTGQALERTGSAVKVTISVVDKIPNRVDGKEVAWQYTLQADADCSPAQFTWTSGDQKNTGPTFLAVVRNGGKDVDVFVTAKCEHRNRGLAIQYLPAANQ